MRREFLQLADTYNPAKHKIAGWFVSEKLDGTRCLWDGGLSRGLPVDQVPWASITDPKTGERKAKLKGRATGLWSRYGNPIMAPDWFLNQLPCCPLDGELWAGRGQFQLCRSICAGDEPDPRFKKIQYVVYSSPSLAALFQTGQIKNTNMVCAIDYLLVEAWIKRRLAKFNGDFKYLPPGGTFREELAFLAANIPSEGSDHCYMHKQVLLTHDEDMACEQVGSTLGAALAVGGEGVVIRDASAVWTPKRHKGILKYKPFNDAEARIVGFTSGRETDKGSKHLGKIGALIVDYEGKRLELSGMTDVEREFASGEMGVFAAAHPGVDMPEWFQGRCFKKGQTVTFKYRELTDSGIPKEARYWRKREGVE